MHQKFKYTLFLLAICIALLSACSTKNELPNILWITVEDISPDLGSYGDKHAHTPVLDSLARMGVRYTNAIATAPVCAPARSSIITGMHSTSLGSQHMRCQGKMPEGFPYFPQLLREKGYYCSNNEKEDYTLNYESLEIWDESGKHAHWRNRNDREQPFFAIFNLTLTHESCISSVDKHARFTKELPEALRADPQQLDLPPYYPDTPEVRDAWARHYDNIAMMDIRVGEILAELEADGLSGNTIVFFYSDHGTGSPRHKRWLYDSGLKVPLLVVAPVKYRKMLVGKPGSVSEELVSFVDLAPTVLHLAGIPLPVHLQGRAFLGENPGPEPSYVYAYRGRMDERYDMQRAVRSRDFKYIRYYEAGKPYTQYMNTPEKGAIMSAIREAGAHGELPPEGEHILAKQKPEEVLYDLRVDPLELNNLADDPQYGEKLEEMRKAHLAWTEQSLDVGFIPESIMRSWEEASGKSIYQLVRSGEVPLGEIRQAALEDDLQTLSLGLSHSNEAVRYWSAIGMGESEDQGNKESIIELLNPLLEDSDYAVRIAAAEALCSMGSSTRALDVLEAGLEQADLWIRLLAALELDEMGELARPAEKAMQSKLDQGDSNKYVIRVVNHALNALNGTQNKVN